MNVQYVLLYEKQNESETEYFKFLSQFPFCYLANVKSALNKRQCLI